MDKIAIVGSGIVGLNLAMSLAKHMIIHVYDKSQQRIEALHQYHDEFGCFTPKEIQRAGIIFHHSTKNINDANVFIIAVPTDLDKDLRPNLKRIKTVSKTIGLLLKKGDIVIVESTVYPKTCEDIIIPVLEKISHLKLNTDFYFAYAPERYSPNDPEYEMEQMTKIVALSHPCIKKRVFSIYKKIAKSIYVCPSLAIAECAKILENTQRSTNIALMNEFSRITHALDIPLHEIIKASATKKGFHVYSPGLVGGYCLPVNPRYMAYQASVHGVDTPLLDTICDVNVKMIDYLFSEFLRFYFKCQKTNPYPRIAIFGLGYKPNTPDTRSSLNVQFARKLINYGLKPLLHDPYPHQNLDMEISQWQAFKDIDICLIMLKHQYYIDIGLEVFLECCQNKAVIMDVGHCFIRQTIPPGFIYWSL